MNNDITDLRSTLFDTLRELKAGTMDIDRAKAINDTAQIIVNSAKVEVDYAKVTGKALDSNFLPALVEAPLPNGILGTTVHLLKG